MTEHPDPPPPAPAGPIDPAGPASPVAHEGWNEDLYQATATALAEPEAASSPARNAGCLLVSLALFVLAARTDGWQNIALLVAVLFFHELGHFAGMRLFGYSNLRMFFIPFFGAAVSGRKHAAPAWQQGTVLLLGPLPGILLGLVIQLGLKPARDDPAGELVLMLVALNAFNLLPIVPLDGGRLIDLLFFARRPLLAALFTGFAALALGVMAVASGSWIVGLLAAVVGLATSYRYRQGKVQRALRDNRPEWPEQVEQMSDAQRRDLFGWAALLNPVDRQPASLAASMRSLHEVVVSRRPGALAWLALPLLYFAGFGVSFGVLSLQSRDTDRARAARAEALVEQSLADFAELARLRARKADDSEMEPVREALAARFLAQSPLVQHLAFDQLLRRAIGTPDIDVADLRMLRSRLGAGDAQPSDEP